MQRTIFDEEHDLFRGACRTFLDREVVPNHPTWEQAGIVDRWLFEAAGKHGFIGFNAPEEHGGGGSTDYRYNMPHRHRAASQGRA